MTTTEASLDIAAAPFGGASLCRTVSSPCQSDSEVTRRSLASPSCPTNSTNCAAQLIFCEPLTGFSGL